MPIFDTKRERRDGNTFFRDNGRGQAFGSSLWEDYPALAIANDPTIGTEYFNDFINYITTMDGLTTNATNSGTAASLAVTAGIVGQLQIESSDGTIVAEDETYVGSTKTSWILAPTSKLWFEARVKFTEANTDDANIIVGLSSIYTANIVQDAGGGPAADYDGIVFFKVFGGTVWQGETSVATSQTTTASLATRASGTWTRVGFKVDGTASAGFYIDGVLISTHTAYLPTAAMGLIFGVKSGTNDKHEKLYVDWVRVGQLRA